MGIINCIGAVVWMIFVSSYFSLSLTGGTRGKGLSTQKNYLRRHFLIQVIADRLKKVHGIQVHASFDVGQAVNAAGQIFGHFARIDRVDAGLLQERGKARQFRVAVEFGAVLETAGPGENRCNRISRSLAAFLMFSVVKARR